MIIPIPPHGLDVLLVTTSNSRVFHIAVLADIASTKWIITVFGRKPASATVTKNAFIYFASI